MSEIFKKIYKVINSCETLDQLLVAKRYLDIALKNKYIAEEFHRSIYFNIYLEKQEEFLDEI